MKWHLYNGEYHADSGITHYLIQPHRGQWVVFREDEILGRYGTVAEAKASVGQGDSSE